MSLRPVILKSLLNQPASIADLQEKTQVSLPTLRKAIQELSDAHWIRVVGQAETNGGRPAMLFGLDDSHFLLVGVHLQLPGIRLVTANLLGDVLHVTEAYRDRVPRPDEVVQRVVDYVAEVRAQFPTRQIQGVGVASPGFIHPLTGDIISIGRVANWQNFPICQRMETALGLPAHIANDVDCMAFAEFQHTRMMLDRNLLYIGFDEGVKASMFLNGQLYKGSLGNAGLIIPDLLHLNAGRARTAYRQVLTIDGMHQLFHERLRALPPDEQTPYDHLGQATNPRQLFQMVMQGAADGLPICVELTETLITALATATANLIYIIQPDKVVVGGLLSRMPPPLYTQLETAIRTRLTPLFTNQSVIEQAALSSPNLAAIGAVYHFLQGEL